MASNSVLSWILVRSGLVDCPKISASTYLRAIAPIGAWFAVVLWAGNMAYILLSVAFIQMLKAAGPICMLVVGIALGVSPGVEPCDCCFLVPDDGAAINAGVLSPHCIHKDGS